MPARRWVRRGALYANLVAVGVASACLGGCERSADRDRYEASAVLRALEVVRGASNEAKRRPADELAHTPCTSPIVCGARDSCAEAYQHLARGTEAALRVKSELDKLEQNPSASSQDAGKSPTADKMAELSNELDRADKEINGAKESMRKCEEAASLMRHTFGI
jgi:hypothetical protein